MEAVRFVLLIIKIHILKMLIRTFPITLKMILTSLLKTLMSKNRISTMIHFKIHRIRHNNLTGVSIVEVRILALIVKRGTRFLVTIMIILTKINLHSIK